MSRRDASSQNFDGGKASHHGRHRAKSARAVVMIPVERIGRDRKRHYCERCGQKRRVCRCEP